MIPGRLFVALWVVYSLAEPTAAGVLRASGRLWAHDALGGPAGPVVRVWDLATDTLITSFALRPGVGRGVAVDARDGNIWNSTLDGLPGDGFIHKNPALGGADLLTLPDPGGIGGPGIGALDYDAEEDVLWAASYQPTAGDCAIFKLDPTSGALLGSCTVPFQGGPVGNDTLAVARPADLGGMKVLLTDAGEELTTLFAIDPVTCAVVRTYTLPVGVTGIDVDLASGEMFAASLSGQGLFYNLGRAPYDTVVAARFTDGNVEDITITDAAPCLLLRADASFPPLTPARTGDWLYATACGAATVLSDPAPVAASEGDLADPYTGAPGTLRLYQLACEPACAPRIALIKNAATRRVRLAYY